MGCHLFHSDLRWRYHWFPCQGWLLMVKSLARTTSLLSPWAVSVVQKQWLESGVFSLGMPCSHAENCFVSETILRVQDTKPRRLCRVWWLQWMVPPALCRHHTKVTFFKPIFPNFICFYGYCSTKEHTCITSGRLKSSTNISVQDVRVVQWQVTQTHCRSLSLMMHLKVG